MGKFYFRKGEEDTCWELETHKEYMEENEIKELELFEAERETGTGYFFCKEFGEIGEVGDGCGRYCDKYKPNNGKNGRCKHYGYTYEMTDKKILLRNIDGLIVVENSVIKNN